MPIINMEEGGIVPSPESTGDKRSKYPRARTLQTRAGMPRFDDLLTCRILEDTPQASLPLNTIKDQITNTYWNITPTTDNPTPSHEDSIDELTYFLDGHFNDNRDKFSHLMRRWVHDTITIDTGVVEAVPTREPVFDDGSHGLNELYNVDGLVMSKEVNEKGKIPEPPEPAYYKYGNQVNLRQVDPSTQKTFKELIKEMSPSTLMYQSLSRKPIPFTRDEIIWTEINPRPREKSVYGYGIIQQVKRWIEILLNQDVSNLNHFSEDEIPKGILNIATNNKDKIDSVRDYVRDKQKGESDHRMMILGGGEGNKWVSTQETLKELQYLESQEWYSQLVWMLFGLNESQIGFDVGSRATAEEFRRQVFMQTTKPLLDTIAEELNNKILPKHEAYWWCDGEVKFSWNIEDPDMMKLERERQQNDLQNGLKTVNDVLRERGEEEKPWGDMPVEAIRSMSQKHPEWFAEQFTDLEDIPSPATDPMGFSSEPDNNNNNNNNNNKDDGDEDLSKGNRNDNGFNPEVDLYRYNLFSENVKDEPLRNERGDYPNISQEIDEASVEMNQVFEDALNQIKENIDETFSKENPNLSNKSPKIQTILNDVNIKDDLIDRIMDYIKSSMVKGTEYEEGKVRQMIEDELDIPEEITIDLDTDVEDTFALKRIKREAVKNMTNVENSVKRKIANELHDVEAGGGGISEARQAIEDLGEDLTENRSRLVARTELMSSSRHGSQAFQEKNEVVGGKEWTSTDDNRTRSWHRVMDGKKVGVDESFTVPKVSTDEDEYQPRDYPRTCFVVGEDQPFNCRCVQRSVLDENMPDDVTELRNYSGLKVKGLNNRQLEIWDEHHTNEKSFKELLKNLDQNHSRSKIHEDIGISKSTYYNWLKDFGLYE